MTSFFSQAAASGYKPDDILQFLTKSIPGFDKKLKDALAMGYTADQVFDFFGKTIGKKESTRRPAPQEEPKGRLTEQEKQQGYDKKNRRQSILENTLDPKHLLATAGGAALGYATGGPAGAVSGAIGGSAGYDDLVRKYEQKVNSGSDISFYDFVKMMMQAAAKGTAVGFSTSQLGSILSSMTPGQQTPEAQQQQPETPPPPPSSPAPMAQEQPQEQIVPEQPQTEQQKSYDLLGKMNMSFVIDSLSPKIDPLIGAGVIKTIFGEEGLKSAAESEHKSEDQIIAEAFQFSREKAGIKEEVAPEEKQLSAEAVEKKKPYNPLSEEFASIFKERKPATEATQLLGKKVRALPGAMQSSNTRGAFYDPDKKNLRVLFAPKEGGNELGAVYSYDNVDTEDFKQMTQGKAKPSSEGENKFGIWFQGKDKSVGSAFNEFIKKNPDKFPHEKIEKENYSVNEKQLAEADRTFLLSELFAPFAEERAKGRNLIKANQLKEVIPTLKSMADNDITEMIKYIEKKLKLKHPPTLKRLEKEIKKELSV